MVVNSAYQNFHVDSRVQEIRTFQMIYTREYYQILISESDEKIILLLIILYELRHFFISYSVMEKLGVVHIIKFFLRFYVVHRKNLANPFLDKAKL